MQSETSSEKPVLPVSINVPPVTMEGDEVLNEINQLENQYENIRKQNNFVAVKSKLLSEMN